MAKPILALLLISTVAFAAEPLPTPEPGVQLRQSFDAKVRRMQAAVKRYRIAEDRKAAQARSEAERQARLERAERLAREKAFKADGATMWTAGAHSRLALFVGLKGEDVLLRDVDDKTLRIPAKRLDYPHRRDIAASYYRSDIEKPKWMLAVIKAERQKLHDQQAKVDRYRASRATAAKSRAIRATTNARQQMAVSAARSAKSTAIRRHNRDQYARRYGMQRAVDVYGK